MTRHWAILDADGKLREQVTSPEHPCEAPGDGNPAYDVPRERVIELDRRGDPAIEDMTPTGGWTLDLDRYKARHLAAVDAARGRHVAADERKLFAHLRKGAETADLLALSTAAFDALDSDERTRRFPWLVAEAAARGQSLAETAAGVRDAMLASEDRLRHNEARAIAAKEAVRAATSREEVDAAATIQWVADD